MLFISYARADSASVRKHAAELSRLGYDTWIDIDQIAVSSRWDDKVEDAIRQAQAIIVFLTPNAVQSGNVKDEVALAVDLGKPVLPVILADCVIPLRLRRMQNIDVRTSADWAQRLHMSISTVSEVVPKPLSEPGVLIPSEIVSILAMLSGLCVSTYLGNLFGRPVMGGICGILGGLLWLHCYARVRDSL